MVAVAIIVLVVAYVSIAELCVLAHASVSTWFVLVLSHFMLEHEALADVGKA